MQRQQPPPTHPHNHRESDTTSEHPNLTTQARQAVVLHAAPTKYKPGLMRRWIEEDNKTAQIQGIRWLLRRIGKLASPLVIYMTETIDLTHGLRMGRCNGATTMSSFQGALGL
ncbi:hypothetical protein L211DRAFT_899508 [Terfezia boudieri ATCC MYA-4762]|uniref:Uncharacterized protein n=1 Tax=Terfezia boudieri ATCC MYA-4762 TaxID=1051890 RepID=A0A3N4LAZ1_9PEZI|nr:hypothetical protein L211DRAFT_899508 [Terfezia boudieri ATCC MYA-4762]